MALAEKMAPGIGKDLKASFIFPSDCLKTGDRNHQMRKGRPVADLSAVATRNVVART